MTKFTQWIHKMSELIPQKEIGEARGEAKGYKNVAIKMIKANKSDLEIHEMTELSLSRIQQLREEFRYEHP